MVKLSKESARLYLEKNCSVVNDGEKILKIVKPLLSDKQKSTCDTMALIEEGRVINGAQNVCSVMNSFFIDVAKHIGSDDTIIGCTNADVDQMCDKYAMHSSISNIQKLHTQDDEQNFHFTQISKDTVSKKLRNLNQRKATGYDAIPPKLLKSVQRR